jgi:hypothetical protein
LNFSLQRIDFLSPSTRALRVSVASHSFAIVNALLYLCCSTIAVLTIGSYFAHMWDVITFVDAAESFSSGESAFDLYERSRANRLWPYAYPPLYAFFTWLVLMPGRWFSEVSGLGFPPDLLLARLPAMVTDVGVGWFLYGWFRRWQRPRLARVALVAWLFNPLTFYNTVAQGHFESTWLFFVLLGYGIAQRRQGADRVFRRLGSYAGWGVLAGLCFAAAILAKQVAAIFVLVYGIWALSHTFQDRRRLVELATTTLITLVTVGLVIWPFHAHSPDFSYMIVDYVANVPVQTQSALVGFLFFTEYNTTSHTSSLPFLQHQIPILLGLISLVTLWSTRRGHDLWSMGTLALLLFVLFSKKVMGYYYVPLVAFLMLDLLRRGHLKLFWGSFLAISWIAISPFYTPFSAEDDLIIYFVLGLFNTLFFLWLFFRMAIASPVAQAQARGGAHDYSLLLHTLLSLQVVVYLTVFAQPLSRLQLPELNWAPVGAWQRPVELELTAPGQEFNALIFLPILLALSLAIAMWVLPGVVAVISQTPVRKIPTVALGALLLFFPLYFSLYYLSKESTASFEFLLQTFLK